MFINIISISLFYHRLKFINELNDFFYSEIVDKNFYKSSILAIKIISFPISKYFKIIISNNK